MNKMLIAAMLWVATAQAGWTLTVEERMVDGLQSQGYTVLEKGYTFLGRLRIVAESDEIHRELVVNPGTGEILRDYAVYLSDIRPGLPNAHTSSDSTRGSSAANPPRQTSTAGDPQSGAATVMGTDIRTLGRDSLQGDATLTPPDIAVDDTLLPMPPVQP